MKRPSATPADVAASAAAAKDRHTLSETACDLIVIEHRLRDVRRMHLLDCLYLPGRGPVQRRHGAGRPARRA